MAISIHPHMAEHGRHPLRPSAALRQAWYWYLTLLFIPFIVAMAVIISLNYRESAVTHTSISHGWFIASLAFMLVAGPVAFGIRSRIFKSYWRGEGVDPRAYLRGMLTVWMAFEIGGLIALVGCLMSNSLLPCLLPALAAFMFFTPLFPNGRAMVRPTGNTDDPEIYQEPR
ncbi:MAG TPA: hypothetical protein VFE47_31385 [Tepidisphaeraceae bacterium]|nr:hypothetical protein [Tepidisphaeraceae bacterium]